MGKDQPKTGGEIVHGSWPPRNPQADDRGGSITLPLKLRVKRINQLPNLEQEGQDIHRYLSQRIILPLFAYPLARYLVNFRRVSVEMDRRRFLKDATLYASLMGECRLSGFVQTEARTSALLRPEDGGVCSQRVGRSLQSLAADRCCFRSRRRPRPHSTKIYAGAAIGNTAHHLTPVQTLRLFT
jgi:hypothetical protein